MRLVSLYLHLVYRSYTYTPVRGALVSAETAAKNSLVRLQPLKAFPILSLMLHALH